MGSGPIEAKKKGSYRVRRQRITETLQGFGLSLGRLKRIVYRYPLNLYYKKHILQRVNIDMGLFLIFIIYIHSSGRNFLHHQPFPHISDISS